MLYKLTSILLTTLLLSHLPSTEGFAQSAGEPLPPGYYIVVVAYRLGQDSYATNYIDRIGKESIDAKYGADLGRKYLYVYLDYYTDFDVSIKEMLAARKKAGFEKAWVRIMKDPLPEKVNLLVEQKQEQEILADTSNVVTASPVVTEEPVEAPSLVEGASPGEITVETVSEEEIEKPVDDAVEENPVTEPVDIDKATVFLSLFNATNNQQIDGEVEIIDTDHARLIIKEKGNEYIKLPDPESKSGKITLLANVFGFRPMQRDINYRQLATD